MSDFSDRPLVAGTITGLRAFSIDKLGRLVGPSYNQVFTPAENLAECRKGDEVFGWQVMSQYYRMPDSLFGPRRHPRPKPEVEPEPKVTHTPGVLDCKCGFYAYFNGRNDYKDKTRVTAIIEGYGVVTMGTEGFRAEKARLAAVVEPGKGIPQRVRDMLHRNYANVPFYATKAEALEAHPMSSERVPNPSDADFWTRTAGLR